MNDVQKTRLNGFGLKTLAALTGVAAIAWFAAGAAGDASSVQVTVTELSSQGEMVRIGVNKGVQLKFSSPIAEARIVNDDIAEVEMTLGADEIIVRGKSFGVTQLVVRFEGNGQRVFDIAVDLELDRLMASIQSVAPRARVKAQSVLDTVVLTGTAPDAESAARIAQIAGIFSDRIVNHLQVSGAQQVLLRVTVAEVNRSATRQLGFNGWMAGDNFPSVFGNSNIGGINPTGFGGVEGAVVSPSQALGNTTAAATAGIVPFTLQQSGAPYSDAVTLSLGFPQLPMQIFVQALRENGLLKVLAEPNLVAISGEEASFLAGGEFPIPVPQENGSVTIEFRQFGVRLDFTPAVSSEGRIRLHVAPEISELDYSTGTQISGYVVPGLVQRRVETEVELGSGQTIAIGGLLSETTRASSQRVPGLGDLPILGPLFRSVEYQHEETELVILVTPELVGGVSPQQVASIPGADIVAPNDFELFLEGRLEVKAEPGRQPKLTPHVNRAWSDRSQQGDGAPVTVMKLRGPIGPAGSDEGS